MKNKTKFCLVQDQDCHWYVIPAHLETEWCAFLELDPDDEESWNVPVWADMVSGSPSSIIFHSYERSFQ